VTLIERPFARGCVANLNFFKAQGFRWSNNILPVLQCFHQSGCGHLNFFMLERGTLLPVQMPHFSPDRGNRIVLQQTASRSQSGIEGTSQLLEKMPP